MSDSTAKTLLEEGVVAHKAERFREAIARYSAALKLQPEHPDALSLLASANRSIGNLDWALQLYERAIKVAPQRADIHYNYGNALNSAERGSEAEAEFTEALKLDPEFVDAAANLGVACSRRGDYAKATDYYLKALEHDPTHRTAANNLGNAYSEQGRFVDAAHQLARVTRLYPDLAEAHYNMSIALLRLGDFGQGFAEYEWRWKSADFTSERRHTDKPDWDGRPFEGKTLLIHAEQGLGDNIQFVRLVPLAKSIGGTIILEVPEALKALFSGFPGVDRLISHGEDPGPVDFQSPMLGLPHRLRLTLGAIPAKVPYFRVDKAKASAWKKRLSRKKSEKLVGLVWQGNPHSPVERGRSIKLEAFAPLARNDVRFISLQRDFGLDQLKGCSFGRQIESYAADLKDFTDTAALIGELDHVVTVDTSVAHLAGALGRPTSTLVRLSSDWRWLAERSDTPWYPTMTLFRQQHAGRWGDVIEEVARDLHRRLV